jgi:Protein of unknown function (DUF3179)
MRRLFYLGLGGLALFEVLNVYFIMPMPGSQRIDSLGFAYFLHAHRWVFRTAFLLAVAAGGRAAFSAGRKWLPALAALLTAAVAWFFNFQMTADRMFLQPSKLVLKPRAESSVREGSVVIGVDLGGEARAYPIRFLVYHHQVQDTVAGKPVLVTYCSVCRTGRVYEPTVDGHAEKFRLVGMDHFNAMFEDAATGSWWRQATGEAVAGPLKGAMLPEIDSSQATLRVWFRLHPASLVMQPDESSTESDDPAGKFERGASKGELTRTDPASWKEKSWVVGIQVGSASKAYDWNRLKAQRVINEQIGSVPIVLALATDKASFAAFERPDPGWVFELKGDVLSANGRSFDLSGRDLAEPGRRLRDVDGHQEFWHSWRTFHPGTLRDP